jgi:membrane dipeptidase
MAYNYSTERDPLLPNDKGAPEIQGSRPQSINNEYVIEEQVSDDDNSPRRNSLNDLMAIVFGICFFGIVFLVLFPDGPLGDLFGDRRPTPKTLEERVNRILEDTPLIGMCYALLIRTSPLIIYRRTQ